MTADRTPGRAPIAASPPPPGIWSSFDPEDRLALDATSQLLRGAEREDLAVIDDGDPVTQLLGLDHVVSGEEQGAAGRRGLPGESVLAKVARRRDVEAERWLVEEEDPRIVEEAAREVQLLRWPVESVRTFWCLLLDQPGDLDELVEPRRQPSRSVRP